MKEHWLVLWSENTFSGQLAKETAPEAIIKYKTDFDDIIRWLKWVNFAILPIQNTHRWPVSWVMRPISRAVQSRTVKILGFSRKEIFHTLVSPAISKGDITVAYSHYQALGQTEKNRLKDGIEWTPTTYTTSKIWDLQPNEAVICSPEAAVKAVEEHWYTIHSKDYWPEDNSTLFMYVTSLRNQTSERLIGVDQERMLSLVTAKREVFWNVFGEFWKLQLGIDFIESIANGEWGMVHAVISDNIQSKSIKGSKKSFRSSIQEVGWRIQYL